MFFLRFFVFCVLFFLSVVFAGTCDSQEIKFFCFAEGDWYYVNDCEECKGDVCSPVKDDWIATSLRKNFDRRNPLKGGGLQLGAVQKSLGARALMAEGASLGLQVGGKKGFDNFYENVMNGYTPLPESISYEAVFYEHCFDIDSEQECKEVMCPVLRGMSGNDSEMFVAFGLKSGIKVEDYKRPHLNLLVVLDISGSMGAEIDRYYYDNPVSRRQNPEEGKVKKIDAAKEVLIGLTEKLEPTDRFGLVLFESVAYLAKPLRLVGATDMDAIRKHIKEDIFPLGGTNFEAGIKKAIKALKVLPKNQIHGIDWETRVVIITDAMPNLGDFSAHGLGRYIKGLAEKHIHTTVVGVGVDFNYRLMDIMNDIEGGNIFSVKSASEFRKLLNEEFEYVFFPLYYDLYATLEVPGYYLDKVIGSDLPEGSATRYVVRVKTLFPAKTTDEGGKGSVILVVLKPSEDAAAKNRWITSVVSLKDREGKLHRKKWIFKEKEVFTSPAHPDLKKAVILMEFVDLMKEWTEYVRDFGCKDVSPEGGDKKKDDWQYSPGRRYWLNPPVVRRSPWEQTSVKLCVPGIFKPQLKEIYCKMTRWELNHGKTEEFVKEKEVLEKLLGELPKCVFSVATEGSNT